MVRRSTPLQSISARLNDLCSRVRGPSRCVLYIGSSCMRWCMSTLKIPILPLTPSTVVRESRQSCQLSCLYVCAMYTGASWRRYLMVAVCRPNFFDGGCVLGKRAPCRTGSDMVPSKRCHQAQKCVKPLGVRWMELAERSSTSVDPSCMLAMTEMEAWTKSERKPKYESWSGDRLLTSAPESVCTS